MMFAWHCLELSPWKLIPGIRLSPHGVAAHRIFMSGFPLVMTEQRSFPNTQSIPIT